MFGEWQVTAKYTSFRAPLGPRYVKPELLSAAEAPEEQGGIGSVVNYSVRFFSTLPDTFDNKVCMWTTARSGLLQASFKSN